VINLSLQNSVSKSHKYMQYSDSSEIHVVKVVVIVTCEQFNLPTLSVVSHFLSVKVSPEWRLNMGFET